MFPEDSQPPAGQPPLDGSSLSKLRDFEKVRERILLRIEPRHVVQLLIAALLLAAAAFVGGYVVGARGYRPAWLGDLLTGPTAAPTGNPALENAAALAAQPSEESVDAQPVGPADAVAGAVDASPGVAAALAIGELAGAGVPVADPGEQVIAAAATAIQAPALAAPSDNSAEFADSEAQPPPAIDVDAGIAAPADAEAAPGDTAAPAPPRVPRAGRPAAGKYMVQIKAFRGQVDADAFAEELRGKGYTVAVSAVEVADKGQFFRVRMGPFGTLDAARAAQRKLEQAEGHATIILATP